MLRSALELFKYITFAPCWSLTDAGRFVFDLKVFSVRDVSHLSPFIVSMALETKNFPSIVGRVLQISLFILSAVSQYPTMFVVLRRRSIGLLGLNSSCFLCSLFQTSSVKFPRRIFCNMLKKSDCSCWRWGWRKKRG